MAVVACPSCGEDEDLAGERDGERIVLVCGRCAHRWERGTTPRCRLCGSDDLEAVRVDTLEEAGRGEQRTPSGLRLRHYCWACRSDDVTSGSPIVGPVAPPGAGTDLDALKGRGRG